MTTSVVTIDKIEETVNNASPGDTVLLKNGTYSSKSLNLTGKGTKASKIFVYAEEAGKVIFTGSSKLTVDGEYLTVGGFIYKDGGVNKAITIYGKHNRITNCDFAYRNTKVERLLDIKGVSCRVDHCNFRDLDQVGCWLGVIRDTDAYNYALIDNNSFGPRPNIGVSNGLESIRVGTSDRSLSSSRSIIENNYFHNCDGEIEVISNKSGENIYRYNTMKNCEGTLTLRHGDKCTVAYNSFEGENKVNSGGVRIIGEQHKVLHNYFENLNGNGSTRVGISFNCGVENSPVNRYFQVKEALVDSNIMVNCKDGYAIGYLKKEADLPPITSTISNTILYNSGSGEVFSSNSSLIGSPDMTYTNNHYYAKNIGDTDEGNKSGNNLHDPSSYNDNVDKTKYGVQNKSYGFNTGFDFKSSELGMNVEEYYIRVRDDVGGYNPDNGGDNTEPLPPPPGPEPVEPSPLPENSVVIKILEDTNTDVVTDQYSRLGEYETIEKDVTKFIEDNKLYDCKFRFDVVLSGTKYYPKRFEYTIENNHKGLIFTIPEPEGGWKEGLNTVEYIPENSDYVDPEDIDWTNMCRVELYRSGDSSVSESGHYLYFKRVVLYRENDEVEPPIEPVPPEEDCCCDARFDELMIEIEKINKKLDVIIENTTN